MYRQSLPSMYPLPESDHLPPDHNEIKGQGKIDGQKLYGWLKIGEYVEDDEKSHPRFKGILLVTGGHPDELETWDGQVEKTSQVHSNAQTEIRSAGSHNETDQSSYSP